MFDEFWNVWKQALDIVDIKKGENFWNIQKFLSLSLYTIITTYRKAVVIIHSK